MRFNSERALRQLLERGVVATMRMPRKGYREGAVVPIENPRGEVVAYARIVAVLPNEPVYREAYSRLSGFPSPKEWEDAARRLYRGALPKLILVLARV